jgi:raffinose/stachyose/melibiose transport system permease protein
LALYGAFILYPAGRTVNLSFWKWDGVNPAVWRGLANYADVATDPVLRGSILHALVLLLYFSALPVALGLVMAALLTRRRLRGLAAFRLVFFLPQILPLIAVGVVWRWVYAPDGLANQLLGLVGLDAGRAWLGEWDWALPAIGLIGAWVQSGLCMMLFVAGAGRIDPALYEAARLDGADARREFFAVTLPGLRAEIGLALTVTVISALASFDLVYITTSGSPGHQTDVPGLLVYQRLLAGDIGHAAALAVVLSGLVVLAAALTNRLATPRDGR